MRRIGVIVLLIGVVLGDDNLQEISHVGPKVDSNNKIDTVDNDLVNTDLVMSFVVRLYMTIFCCIALVISFLTCLRRVPRSLLL